MWSSSVSALAPATRPCRMPRAYPSASIILECSTPPHSPLPYSQTMFGGQEVERAAVTARTSGHAMTSRGIQPPATTHATKCARQPHRATGRTASNCPSRRLYTIADTHASGAHMCPACPLFPSHQPCPILAHPSYPKTTTKISPSHPSRSTARIVDCHRHERHVLPLQMLLAQLACGKAASLLPVPLARANRARMMPIF
jgi:hypothetical protein